MQSMMLMWSGRGDDMALPFHQHTFSPFGTFSREPCEPEGLFFSWLRKVLFLSENMPMSSDMLAGDKSSPHSHHQPHLISAKHYSAEKWLMLRCLWSVEVRRDSPWGRIHTLSAECVTLPRLVLFVFFCRQINNSWIFYDCLLALR